MAKSELIGPLQLGHCVTYFSKKVWAILTLRVAEMEKHVKKIKMAKFNWAPSLQTQTYFWLSLVSVTAWNTSAFPGYWAPGRVRLYDGLNIFKKLRRGKDLALQQHFHWNPLNFLKIQTVRTTWLFNARDLKLSLQAEPFRATKDKAKRDEMAHFNMLFPFFNSSVIIIAHNINNVCKTFCYMTPAAEGPLEIYLLKICHPTWLQWYNLKTRSKLYWCICQQTPSTKCRKKWQSLNSSLDKLPDWVEDEKGGRNKMVISGNRKWSRS